MTVTKQFRSDLLTRRKDCHKDKSGKKEIAHRNGVTKAEKGHFDKAGVSGKRYVKEFRFENAEEYTLAQEIKADIFAAGDKVDATAISKGKGFKEQSSVTIRAEDL